VLTGQEALTVRSAGKNAVVTGRRRIKVVPVTSPGPQSALIVEVPEAEPVVRQHRERLDASAPLGIPAHITVLFPFMPPAKIDEPVLAQLERLFAAVSRFRFRLDHTAWFGDTVLWLAPRDPRLFRALTQCVYETFPAFPPFEGQFGDVVPHLTVGHGRPLNELRTAEKSVRAHLPIEGHAPAVTLMIQQSAGRQWTKAATFTLA
jgi:2'-5' RNA ligase